MTGNGRARAPWALALAAVAAAVLSPATAAAQAPLLGGLGGAAGYGTSRVHNNDDGSWSGASGGTTPVAIPITTAFGARGLNFFGTFYTSMYVNNNGNITFRGALGGFTPLPFPIADQPMIAPFWADVDTRTPAASGTPPTGYGVYWDVRAGQVVVTWHNVGYYSSRYDRLNNFQLILRDRSDVVAGDFDVEFRYSRCEWHVGEASGGGPGGMCAQPLCSPTTSSGCCAPGQAGFDAGDRTNHVTVPDSRTPAILTRLCAGSNLTPAEAGVWRYQIRSGRVAECGNSRIEMSEECDDGNTRGGDGCSGSCRNELAPGAACTRNDQCRSQFCADGVCCNAACNGQCEACDLDGAVGFCSAVTGAPRGSRPACAGAGACAGTCDGMTRSLCTYPGTTTSCAPGACAAGTETTAGACDGMGACAAGATRACAPYACGATACRTDCATDADCAEGNFCNASMRCVPRQPAGASCTAAGQCASGQCVDGVCCNTACNGQCEACNLDGMVGTCTAAIGVPRGTRPACAGAAGGACSGRCDGMARDRCAYPGAETSCRTASCAMGAATLAAVCDGMGACPAPSTTPCAPFGCGATTCRTDCAADADCATGNFCAMGRCAGRRPSGGMCAAGTECASGHCTDGVCCETACNGQCEACDVAGMLGTCAPVMGMPRGARAPCSGEGTCGGRCDGTQRAACVYPGSSTRCREASCAGGVATRPAGCDGMGACPAAATTPCGAYACGATACRTDCATDADCATGQRCAMGRCGMPAGPGAACARDVDCASGACAQGVCCERACDGVCAACDLAGRVGTCSPRPQGARPGVGTDGGVATTDASVSATCLACDGRGGCEGASGVDAGVDGGGTFAGTSSGCGCAVPGARAPRGVFALALVALGLVAARRRRAR